jgi:DNA-binding transcriptional LysR family regulator
VRLHHLEYFRTIARCESYTRASEQIEVSQPTLSRAIALLERELGVPLFDHHGRSVSLNRYGRAFLVHIDRALADIEAGRRELDDLTDRERGVISLTFFHTLGERLVPNLIGAFMRKHPRARFILSENMLPQIVRRIIEGDVDLGLVSLPFSDERLEYIPLLNQELMLVVPSAHRLAARKKVALAEVADDPFCLSARGFTLRQLTEDLCKEAGFSPKIAFEGDEVSTLRGLISAGLGVGLLPEGPSASLGEIVQIRVSQPRCQRMIVMAWVKDGYQSELVRSFRHFVQRRVGLPDQPKS